MKCKITVRGIEKARDDESGPNVFESFEAAKAERNRRIAAATKPLTEEQKHDKWLAEHGVPSVKSLKSLDEKLAAIKQAEKIENGSEEL